MMEVYRESDIGGEKSEARLEIGNLPTGRLVRNLKMREFIVGN